MKKFFVLIVLTLAQSHLFSQSLPKKTEQANWQQRADYNIEVSLNDSARTLSAFEKITYTNNSPQALDRIYIHLWPNAYKNRTTAYARQELENNHTAFHFFDTTGRGYIDSLDFKINGKPAKWELTADIDIAIIYLETPLLPGASTVISTPFKVKLPAVLSRMGYEDGVFCITQWYPKPAVYDVNGWNPMPYLNQGEFYSEYGKFEVKITVPMNMLVAATGQVQDPREKEWWLERSKSVRARHFSDEPMKTLLFVQDSVHDFAWFASKDFMADMSEVILPNGHRVETWIFAKPKDEKDKPKGVEHINEAIKFYSSRVGNYPYSIAQVVVTPLKAGGGMEYPTITNCASNDRTVIVHEVGHNWFYGILGSNERDYPWMDESFNTYYETRQHKEGKPIYEPGEKLKIPDVFTKMDQNSMLFKYTSRKNIDQAGNLHSTAYTDNNYGSIIYAKNPIAFEYLQNYLGTPVFDSMMHTYYETWKFRHPLPSDFRKHAESFTGKDLSWFFDGVLGSTQKMDYKMAKAKDGYVTISNKGTLISPVPVSVLNEDSVLQTFWFDGFKGTKTFKIPPVKYTDRTLVYRIDARKNTLDLYRQNNTATIKGKTEHTDKLKLQFLGNMENDNAPQIFWSPVYAYNVYNKSMLGLAFYNSLFPQKKNEFIIMPVYSFNTKDVNGYVSYWHNFYTDGKIRNIQAGFQSARFASQGFFFNSGTSDTTIQNSLQNGGAYYGNISYEKVAPFVKISLQPNNRRSLRENNILLRYVMINEQAADRGYFYNFGTDHYGVAQAEYAHKDPNALYAREIKIGLQSGVHRVNFNKLTLEVIQNFTYYKAGAKTAEIRFFAGSFLFHKEKTAGSASDLYESRAYMQAGANSGQQDYLYDEAMIGRVEQLGNIANSQNPDNTSSQALWGRQVLYQQSGFRNFGISGSSNTFLSALNITLPAPIPVPIGVYSDMSFWQTNSAMYLSSGSNTGKEWAAQGDFVLTYNAGIYFSIIPDILNVYIPLAYSTDIKNYYETNGYTGIFSHTSFVLKLNKLNPIKAIRDIKL